MDESDGETDTMDEMEDEKEMETMDETTKEMDTMDEKEDEKEMDTMDETTDEKEEIEPMTDATSASATSGSFLGALLVLAAVAFM